MICFLAAVDSSAGQQFNLESAGARFGFYPFGAGSHFYQAETFANWNLPVNWDLDAHWRLQSRAEGSLGGLAEANANAVIGSVGPGLLLTRQNLPISFEGGISVTLLSRSDFRDKNFGEALQFTSHAGLNFDFTARFRLSYRFQHMSNGSLSSHNPGLNLQMFGLSYLF